MTQAAGQAIPGGIAAGDAAKLRRGWRL